MRHPPFKEIICNKIGVLGSFLSSTNLSEKSQNNMFFLGSRSNKKDGSEVFGIPNELHGVIHIKWLCTPSMPLQSVIFLVLQVLWCLNFSTLQLAIRLNYHAHGNNINKILSLFHVS